MNRIVGVILAVVVVVALVVVVPGVVLYVAWPGLGAAFPGLVEGGLIARTVSFWTAVRLCAIVGLFVAAFKVKTK